MLRRTSILICAVLLCVILTSCGQSFELQSLTINPSAPNLEGLGAFQTLTATAHFSNTKTQDVTAHTTFVLGPNSRSGIPLPADTLTLNQNVLEVINGVCTWDAEPTDALDTTFAYSTDPFIVTATFTSHGITQTAQAFISVDSIADCFDGQSFPAPKGYTGTQADPSAPPIVGL